MNAHNPDVLKVAKIKMVFLGISKHLAYHKPMAIKLKKKVYRQERKRGFSVKKHRLSKTIKIKFEKSSLLKILKLN